MWAALAKLPPAQRAAVVQRYYLGRSEDEMAGSGDSPPGAAESGASSGTRSREP